MAKFNLTTAYGIFGIDTESSVKVAGL